MSRMVGTVSRGLRAPIIREGDNLVDIVTNSVLEASKDAKFDVQNRDVVAMTEAIVARAQGNYATVDDIAADVKAIKKVEPYHGYGIYYTNEHVRRKEIKKTSGKK